jgi:hypothetical protein
MMSKYLATRATIPVVVAILDFQSTGEKMQIKDYQIIF